MQFGSIDFLLFFIVVLIGTVVIEHFFSQRVKEYFLLIGSYFFYGYWDWRFCFLLLFVTTVSYCAAKAAKSRLAYITGIIVPLLALGIFKYSYFFLSSVMAIAGYETAFFDIMLPVGISFYTFQALSYVIDVRRGKITVENDFIKLSLYISFFPQLVAGPIIRASDFLPQLREKRRVSMDSIKCGIQIFAFGLFKKTVIADHLSVLVDDVYNSPAVFHWATILLALVSYSLQIYFDFSGYSDMAVGCAKCLGYDFNRNFNMPYISQSVTEFWHRWHISLSSWLKEYLYIPLGGNRGGRMRQYLNLFLTMLISGLWHGANWTFVFWGGLNGVALCVDKWLSGRKNQGKRFLVRIVCTMLTFMFITFTFIFFRADSFKTAGMVIWGILTFQDGIRHPYTWSFIAIAVLGISTAFAILKARKQNLLRADGYYPMLNLDSVGGLTGFFVAVGLILCLAYTGENPFIYFLF